METDPKESPIGLFDSGVGGLTVWDEIVRLMPGEHTVYLADSAHAPYGERSADAIRELSRKNTRHLLGLGCKLIVVACNTATTNAIASLRREFGVPFIGIEPAIKPAALGSRSGRVGVLATRGTLGSELFATTSRNHAADIRILEREGEGLVSMIEAGRADDPALRSHLERLLDPMLKAGIDHLVLGCTHYPLLKPVLADLLPKDVQVLDCGLPVARQARAVLQARGLLRPADGPPRHRIYTNGDPAVTARVLARLGYSLAPEHRDF